MLPFLESRKTDSYLVQAYSPYKKVESKFYVILGDYSLIDFGEKANNTLECKKRGDGRGTIPNNHVQNNIFLRTNPRYISLNG
jgi:hypothetical protein